MKNTVEEFFNDLTFDDYIPNISFKMYSIDVECEVRTIRATWTRTLAEDLQLETEFGIDAEAELTRILQSEISKVTINSIYGVIGTR